MDLTIRHARLKGRPGSWDIGINGDRIAALSEKITDAATLVGCIIREGKVLARTILQREFVR